MSTTLMKPLTRPTARLPSPQAERLLAHLDDETSSLAAMLAAVRGVHQALRQLDDEGLGLALEAESRELASSTLMQQRRHRLQVELAPGLGLAAPDVTLRRLVTVTSGPMHDAIDHGWRLLAEMASEIERLNRQNAAMIGQSLAIARGVVERLTGVSAVGESYNAGGARVETHVGPLIQWGG
jgi:hypothetical protein